MNHTRLGAAIERDDGPGVAQLRRRGGGGRREAASLQPPQVRRQGELRPRLAPHLRDGRPSCSLPRPPAPPIAFCAAW
eukprot:6692366-Prymnesium_polylepis.1